MRFCRSCYAALEDDETICGACGAKLYEKKLVDETVPEGSKSQDSPLVARQSKAASPVRILKETRETPRQTSRPARIHRLENVYSVVTLAVVVAIAVYLLGQHVINTDVITPLHDEEYRSMILSQLHLHPSAYYPIVDALYRQMYSALGPLFTNDFPLIFYIWLLAPTIGDIKWLYFAFALAGTIASYFAIYAATRRGLVAVLSAVWMAYFLETEHYLMYEYWAMSVFLVGLALFFMKRHVLAAVTVGVATLLKEVFAPFMLIASLYYLISMMVKREPPVYLLKGKLEARNVAGNIKIRKEVYVWIVATCVVGFLWYLNGLVSTRGNVHFSHSPFTTNKPGFKPEALSMLFSAGCCYLHVLPPVPTIIVIAVALAGIAFLEKDQRIVLYASFVMLPLLILLGVAGYGSGFGEIYGPENVPRWTAMSVTMVNLFWLTGTYRICEYICSKMRH